MEASLVPRTLPLCVLLALACGSETSGSDALADGAGGAGGMELGRGGSDEGAVEPGGAGGEVAMAMDECGLDTGFPGDEFCILPPPAGEGFQIHVGPEDYDDPDALYVLDVGAESTDDFARVSGNEEDVYFYFRQYRMRPTAHHMILSTTSGSAGLISALGRRIGTANVSQDYPTGGIIAPENEGVGLPLAASSNVNVSLHAINTTDAPALREIWVNFWYRDPDAVTEVAEQWFNVGSYTFAVQPYEETTLGPYTCDVPNESRLLWLYGHRHANNTRFSVTRVRESQRDLIYEGFEWDEPMLLQYNSLVENPTPDRNNHIEGGWSGILDLMPGDVIEWECDIVNQNDTVLRFSNQTYLGEMCIVDAEAVGTDCLGI